MTGYGKSENVIEGHYFKIEIKSVNHRYLDITVRMPRQFQYMEDKFKNKISEKITRGKIEIFVNYECYSDGNYEVYVDRNLAKIYKDAYDAISDYLKIENDLTVSGIVKTGDVIRLKSIGKDEEKLQNIACSVLDDAINKILNMKSEEGMKLAGDIADKNNEIKRNLNEVEKIAPVVPVEYKERILKRLEEFTQSDILDESRIITEVALYADKCSIDEEIVRLKSHIEQLNMFLKSKVSIGKKMDFLVQEMNREINTMGAKANNLNITKHVVEMKSELEKIREQLQNIE